VGALAISASDRPFAEVQAATVLQQLPAHALVRLVAGLLDATHIVHHYFGMPDDVALVECDLRSGQVLTAAGGDCERDESVCDNGHARGRRNASTLGTGKRE